MVATFVGMMLFKGEGDGKSGDAAGGKRTRVAKTSRGKKPPRQADENGGPAIALPLRDEGSTMGTGAGTAEPPSTTPVAATPPPVEIPPPAAVATSPDDAPPVAAETYRSPLALVPSRDGKTLFVAEHTTKRVALFDVAAGKVTKHIPLPDRPEGMALAPDGSRLFVAGASLAGRIHVVDVAAAKVSKSIPVGHTPVALAVSPDGAKLYACNRFTSDISVVDLAAGKETGRIRAIREPVAAALTPDGGQLWVANHLPSGPSNAATVAASITVIDTGSGRVAKTIPLPNGSNGLRGIWIPADGRHAYVTHILARHHLSTTQLERGWMNTNALSVLDVASRKHLNTVLLDSVERGAANPWGVTGTDDGKVICVAHAGTHEVSVIDREGLHDRLDRAAAGMMVTEVTSRPEDVPRDLGFLEGVRRRIPLAGLGPRGIALIGTTVFAAEYFSDSLAVTDIRPSPREVVRTFPLGPMAGIPLARRGEAIFHDARRCFQQWQSCSSCHPDARVDGLNWDLLNDGLGSFKNVRSLLLSHKTPPVMSLGVRDKAEDAVRAGFKFIQYAVVPEADSAAVDAYLKSLKPVPSPYLEGGRLSAAARRGKSVYGKAGCIRCHPPPLLTDLRQHDVGTGIGALKGKPIDTPTLREVWRTAPYLHDGRAATMRDVLVTLNKGDGHGAVSKLTPQELADLIVFVLSQ
jgi:YVTN family beta-propeller protein